ncbi:hypothetical protein [Limosilactobacillus sp.]|uniref:hypothetical protein n=1 Tax=Limosilactobacillus sp. TaxID=2773925 RepID=UPI00345E7081
MTKSKNVWWVQQSETELTMGFQPEILKEWGTIRFLDLPLLGTHLIVGDRFVTVEASQSLTYASSLIAGTITAINSQLNGWVSRDVDPSQWLVKIRLDPMTTK